MKKLLLLPAMLASLPAFAQKIDTHPERPDTLRVTVTGDLNIVGVYRDDTLTGMGAGGRGFGSSVWTFEGDVGVRLDIEMQERIAAAISLRSQRVTGGGGFGIAADNGLIFLGADTNAFGANPEQTGVFFDEANISFNEFFDPVLHLKLGIVPVVFDLRGRGHPFFFDPRHSATFSKNAGATVFGLADELQPSGAVLVYERDRFTGCVFLLPAIFEGGDVGTDEAAYGVYALFAPKELGDSTRVGAIVSVNSFAGSETSVWTIGGGIDFFGLTDGLEIYGEVYFQFGDAGLDAAGDDRSARGWALQAGVEYRLPKNERNIWFGLGFQWISGDEDASDDRVENFLSYENMNELLVLEDPYTGLDLDTNYLSFKFRAGISFVLGNAKSNNLDLTLVVAINQLAEDLTFGGVKEDAIGHEIDFRGRIAVTKQLSFETAFGFLFNAEVFDRVFLLVGDDAAVWTLGTRLIF